MSGASLLDLVQELQEIKPSGERLRGEWFAFEGKEDFGIWLLRPAVAKTERIRAAFSLFTARAIEALAIPQIPTPRWEQHFPDGEQEWFHLPGGLPYGLSSIDRDAVDPCTRAWLELLRRESAAFRVLPGIWFLNNKSYKYLSGRITDVYRLSKTTEGTSYVFSRGQKYRVSLRVRIRARFVRR
jgi:hypothetical protein